MDETKKVELGSVFLTPGVITALQESEDDPAHFLARHQAGDWGDLDPEDRQANEDALRRGERLLSAYETSKGTRLWIITEADRSSTTLLLPDEY